MNHRRPRTALRSSALPSLAALLASGVVVEGCDSATDPAERRERLSSHGENAASAFQGSRLGDAFKEIGIGLGLIAPSASDIGPAGAVPMVNPQPPMQPSGAVAPVQPTPPTQPPEPVAHPAGGPMRIAPVPPPPVVVPHPNPPEHRAVPGGLRAVHPQPPPPVEAPPRRPGG